MLFKILQGDKSRISLDITPFHEGWCYVTTDGGFYVDMNIGTEEVPSYHRVEVTSKSAYQIAVQQGFEGDEAAWLESLKGEPGNPGVWVGSEEPPEGYVVQIDLDGEVEESPKIQIEAHNISETAHSDIRSLIGDIKNILNNIPVSDVVTKDNRYKFTRVAKGITYTEEDHPNKIVYGSSFQFENTYTPEDLVGRTYYGYDFGTLDGDGFISISIPKTKYLKGEKSIPVSYSWSVVNNQRSNQPAINRAVIGIYNFTNLEANLNMPVEERTTMTYFDDYEYFGTISNGSYLGQTNSEGLYTETLHTADREGVTRDITYTASKITSWGYNSTAQVSSNHYSGVTTLDISNLEAGTYRIMFTNYMIPDWPIENLVDGSPYQILAEVPITIYEKEV